ncbi:MAG: hypothetical protein RID59_06190, partial [Hoeflea sp.]
PEAVRLIRRPGDKQVFTKRAVFPVGSLAKHAFCIRVKKLQISFCFLVEVAQEGRGHARRPRARIVGTAERNT